MPYNVICLSSTVMGVFVGSTLNTLVYRPGKLLSMDAGSRKRRKIRLAISTFLLLALGLALAIHVDAEFAGQVDIVQPCIMENLRIEYLPLHINHALRHQSSMEGDTAKRAAAGCGAAEGRGAVSLGQDLIPLPRTFTTANRHFE
eukprot:571742-Pelagomonas_calceolata.AAC.1